MPLRKKIAICLVTILATLFSLHAMAHQGATGIVKERMELMKSIAASMKTLGRMFKGETAYEPDVVRKEAAAMEKRAVQMLSMFPKGSNQHPTEATPEVWTKTADFAEEARLFEAAAAALRAAAADKNAAQEKYLAANETCKSCHKDYRAKTH
ncbi:MAG: hypothetical protein RLZ98_599 [Pseudomonadota bacterium]|jgi:cytochrome c556